MRINIFTQIGAAVIEDLPVGSNGEEGDAQEEESYEDMVRIVLI